MLLDLTNPSLNPDPCLGVALKHDQIRVGLREQCRERHLRRQHRPSHLSAGRQPHHRLRWPPPTPGLRDLAQCKYFSPTGFCLFLCFSNNIEKHFFPK